MDPITPSKNAAEVVLPFPELKPIVDDLGPYTPDPVNPKNVADLFYRIYQEANLAAYIKTLDVDDSVKIAVEASIAENTARQNDLIAHAIQADAIANGVPTEVVFVPDEHGDCVVCLFNPNGAVGEKLILVTPRFSETIPLVALPPTPTPPPAS